MTHQTSWLKSTDFKCNKTDIVSMLLETQAHVCVAGDLSFLRVCRQAWDTLTACEWHMTIDAARHINISFLS